MTAGSGGGGDAPGKFVPVGGGLKIENDRVLNSGVMLGALMALPGMRLLTATMNKDLAGLKKGLEDGADANTAMFGMTPLAYAAKVGFEDGVALLAGTVDALATPSDGMNALMWAAKGGFSGCVRLLAPFGGADQRGLTNAMTALMHAAAAGDLESVEILLPISDVRATNRWGSGAMHQAAGKGAWDVMLRLAQEFEGDERNVKGETALDVCRERWGEEARARIGAEMEMERLKGSVRAVRPGRGTKGSSV